MSAATRAPDSRLYIGKRLMRGEIGVGVFVVWRDEGGGDEVLDPRNDLVNHSPDGFEWGYGGSGPSQLALAIVADVAGDAAALDLYQAFKADVIAGLDPAGFALTAGEVRAKLDELRARGGVRQ